ncbi:uncharacterized protein LOC144704415 isoform X2 [Wolffia australiana]
MAEGKLDLPEDLFPSKPGGEPWKLKADTPRSMRLEKELIGLPDDLKDPLNSENIPLTPQWLYAKTNDSKATHSAFSGEVRGQHMQSQGMPSDTPQKEGWRLDGSHDKKDWRRAPPEVDINRRWREEERETGLLGRRERKKEGDRDKDFRKGERRIEAPTRDNDQRSMPSSDKWPESSARRDSKWSSRWGPDDKEDPRAEKKISVDKDDVGASRALAESDARDKWRPRHRQDIQSGGLTGYRAAPGFGFEKSRPEGQPSGFAPGRGRSNLAGSASIGKPVGASPIGFSEITAKNGFSADAFRYPRGKLLDIYRKRSLLTTIDGLPVDFEKIPTITLSSKANPLAFIAPDAEEEALLDDIWKGKIISGDVSYSSVKPNISKFEDSAEDGHEDSDFNLPFEMASSGQTHVTPESVVSYMDDRDVSNHTGLSFLSKIGETAGRESISTLDGHSTVISQRRNFDPDVLSDLISGNERFQKDSYQMASAMGVPPEEMSFLYQDPQGDVQGPFLGVDIISWFDQGFFGTDLPVRLSDAPEGTPFKALGEVMPALKLRAKDADVSEANPKNASGIDVPRPLSGQRTSRQADRIDVSDHTLSRSLPDMPLERGPDAEEVLYRGRFPEARVPNPSREMEDAGLSGHNEFHHPLGLFLSELEVHQKRPLSTMEQRVDSASVHDMWPNANSRNPFHFHDPTVVPQSPHFEQDRGRLSREESMLLQQLQLQHLQQQSQRLPPNQQQMMGPHASELENILKLQYQQQQLLHLQQQQQQQKEQSHVQQLLLEQLLHRQLQESSYGAPPQSLHDELLFQEHLHHHLKQQQSLDQLHARFGQRHLDHPSAELEYLEAMRTKQNQGLLEQQQLLLRLRREQQLQQLQEERHQLLSRNWPHSSPGPAQLGAHQSRPGFDQSAHFEHIPHALYEPRTVQPPPELASRLQGFGNNVQFPSALRPRHHPLAASEPDGQFPRGLLEAEMMRNEEKSARLLMGLMGSREVVAGDGRDPSQGPRDGNWSFAKDPYGHVSVNAVSEGQIAAIESAGRLPYPSRSMEMLDDRQSLVQEERNQALYRDSLENFFDVKDGAMAKKSWSNVKPAKGPASEVPGGSMGFYDVEMNEGGDPSGGLMMMDSRHPGALLKHHRQVSLPSQEPLPQLSSQHSFADNNPESGGRGGGISGMDIPPTLGAAGEVDPAGASFMDMLLTAKRAQLDADVLTSGTFEGDGGAAAAKASNRRKGKKGKQIDPSLLGFKVHSNRIMMGEIQRPEDV